MEIIIKRNSDNKDIIIKTEIHGDTNMEGYYYWISFDGVKIARLIASPTNDCQTFSIAGMEDVFAYVHGINNDINDLLKVIKLCKDQTGGKLQLLTNVCKDYNVQIAIDKLFSGYMTIKEEYTSTRDSQMVMYLLTLNHL